MLETERVKSSEPFRQGDILKIDIKSGDLWQPAMGVIINADCDLMHSKLDGVISYLPLYTFSQYLQKFWAPKFVDRQTKVCADALKKLCGINTESVSELERWLTSEALEKIVEKLTKGSNIDGKKLREKLTELSVLKLSSKEPYEAFIGVCKRQKNPQSFARKQIRDAQKNMGDGHFFINEVLGEDQVGFVVRMRRIYAINVTCCYRSTSAQMSSSQVCETSAVRFARLTPSFRFRLAQVFAQQYSRIGLPDEIISLSELAVDDMIAQIDGDRS